MAVPTVMPNSHRSVLLPSCVELDFPMTSQGDAGVELGDAHGAGLLRHTRQSSVRRAQGSFLTMLAVSLMKGD
jgi:hypothetical protein